MIGEDRRRAHLVALLADRYPAPAPELADLVRRIDTDPATRTTVLHLHGGGRLVDHGHRLIFDGPITDEAARAIAGAAAAHGWKPVRIHGPQAFKDAVAVACALREPPLPTDHALSRKAAERVACELRERAAAALPRLDVVAVQQLAASDPRAAADQVLAHAEARARAALAGRPTGSTDPRELAAPRQAELTERRDQAGKTPTRLGRPLRRTAQPTRGPRACSTPPLADGRPP
ncbi:LPD7 domain-containing protein [Pseudoroseomonas wenyumeiae]